MPVSLVSSVTVCFMFVLHLGVVPACGWSALLSSSTPTALHSPHHHHHPTVWVYSSTRLPNDVAALPILFGAKSILIAVTIASIVAMPLGSSTVLPQYLSIILHGAQPLRAHSPTYRHFCSFPRPAPSIMVFVLVQPTDSRLFIIFICHARPMLSPLRFLLHALHSYGWCLFWLFPLFRLMHELTILSITSLIWFDMYLLHLCSLKAVALFLFP